MVSRSERVSRPTEVRAVERNQAQGSAAGSHRETPACSNAALHSRDARGVVLGAGSAIPPGQEKGREEQTKEKGKPRLRFGRGRGKSRWISWRREGIAWLGRRGASRAAAAAAESGNER